MPIYEGANWQVNFLLLITMMSLLVCGCSGYALDKGVFRDVAADVKDGPLAGTTIFARQYVARTVHISGGHYESPYKITMSNTEYILDGDIIADGTAISIQASKVVLNLNNKTITYNQTTPGEGVTSDAWNKADIAIINGSIIQGAAMSEGDQYGTGNNPIRINPYLVNRLQIANIYARYNGRDVSGFKLKGNDAIVESNTIEDTYEFGTVKNRHQGIDAMVVAGERAIIRNNSIINARHRGISIGHHAQVYGNNISIRSICTNSAGVLGWGTHDVEVHNNIITASGEHPIGVSFSGPGTNSIHIYRNVIDSQTTRLGAEYGGSASCWNPTTPCGNYAVGIRITQDLPAATSIHDNIIVVRTDSAYPGSYSPTGAYVKVNGKGRGLMVGLAAGGSALVENNNVTALDKDGTGNAYGLVCTGNNMDGSNLTFKSNIVTSNIHNVILGDEYGWCSGHPLFVKNTFINTGKYNNYKTIAAGFNGYFEGTGTFISNTYLGGASESSINVYFQNVSTKSVNSNKSLVFGRLLNITVRDKDGNLVPNAMVRIYGVNGVTQYENITNAGGESRLIVYDYELNNNNGTTGNTIPIKLAFRPHAIELCNLPSSQTSCTILDVSSSAWDALSSIGTYTLSDVNGSITIDTSVGKGH